MAKHLYASLGNESGVEDQVENLGMLEQANPRQ
jgi:hypothetical protein